tara:strand:- start:449 stop:1009 length:561 start_codon:yes stop_codon:yes gene_type:complete
MTLVVNNSSLVKLKTVTISNDAAVTFDNTIITDAFQTYKVIGSNILLASDDNRIEVTLSTNNGSSYTTSGYAQAKHTGRSSDSDSTTTFRGGASKESMRLTGSRFNCGAASGEKTHFEALYHGLRQSNADKFCSYMTSFADDSGTVAMEIGITGTTNVTGAVDNIKFVSSSGNLTSGTMTIYGVRV